MLNRFDKSFNEILNCDLGTMETIFYGNSVNYIDSVVFYPNKQILIKFKELDSNDMKCISFLCDYLGYFFNVYINHDNELIVKMQLTTSQVLKV